MNIIEIYNQYKIMPQLQEHQLKVAGVASLIINNLSLIINKREIIIACLLHDMGNIIKFDLSQAKNILNLDLDLNYWQGVKDEYIKQYGSDEHLATIKIGKELNLSGRILDLIYCVGFGQAEDNLKGGDLAKQICAYADMRVMPKGVVNMDARFADLRVRYAHRAGEWGGQDKREVFEKSLKEIEKRIFENCKIKPGDITEGSVLPIMLELKEFNI